jgi:HlyD family secretion protein
VRAVLKWMRRHPIWSGIAGLLLLFLVYKVVVPSPPEYEYVAVDADRGEVLRVVSASGKLRALNTFKIGSEVSGQVTAVYVDFNSPVKAGQVLAVIDGTRPRARVAQSGAQVDVAQAALAQAQAAIARARTDVEIQEREYARRKQLAERGFISKAAIDQAQNNLSAARAALKTAIAQAQSGQAQIAQSSAELSSAQLDLRRTRILAPASGVVVNKLIEPGATVAASFQTPNLFEIAADTSRMQVEASVDEADIGQVQVGQQVLVILDVDNEAGKLLTGMTANVDIITGRKPNALRVPVAATRFRPRPADRPKQEDKSKAPPAKPAAPKPVTVWVAGADPYKPVRRTVTLGLQGEEFVEVVRGLRPGEKVLTRSKSLIEKEEDEGEEEEDGASL